MSKFQDLLNAPLPSTKIGPYIESTEDLFNEGVGEECQLPGQECGGTGEECGNCGNEGEDPMAAVAGTGTAPDLPAGGVDDEPVPDNLTPEQDQRIDDTMNAVATPMLIASELDEAAIKDLVESTELDTCVQEGFLTERTVVRFDKNARKAQLYEVAVAACAREANDPLMRKLDTVYKMERVLKARLRKKYHTQANRKVKEYLKRAKGSKSGLLARIAAKLSGGKK